MPLLYWNLHAVCPAAVPATTLDQLKRYFHTITLRNMFLVRELSTLLSMLDAHGIPAIPYKGPVLATSVYGNLALRQFRDLDVLLRAQDAARAKHFAPFPGIPAAAPDVRHIRSPLPTLPTDV
jgi:hypothetical protein